MLPELDGTQVAILGLRTGMHGTAMNMYAGGVADQSPPLSLEQTIRAWHDAGHSKRAIARELNIDRRNVRQIIEQAA